MNPFLLFGYPLILREYLDKRNKEKKYRLSANNYKKIINVANNNFLCVKPKENLLSEDIYTHFILTHNNKVTKIKNSLNKEGE